MDFTGFETIYGLPSGDFREKQTNDCYHSVGIRDSDDITTNEYVVYVECGKELVGYNYFSKIVEPKEVEIWIDMLVESHKTECQYNNLNPLGHNFDWFKFATLMKIMTRRDFEWWVSIEEDVVKGVFVRT